MMSKMKLVVGITGASGVIYGKRLLEVLKEKGVETHLVVSRGAEEVLHDELGINKDDLEKLARFSYSDGDLAAPVASGSFLTDGMVIVPCSMKSLSAIVHGFSESLLLRAADVTIKQGRKLILVPREAPLSQIHLENMLRIARMGVTIVPAMPGFYHRPKSIQELVDFVVGKVLDALGIEHELFQRWTGRRSQ